MSRAAAKRATRATPRAAARAVRRTAQLLRLSVEPRCIDARAGRCKSRVLPARDWREAAWRTRERGGARASAPRACSSARRWRPTKHRRPQSSDATAMPRRLRGAHDPRGAQNVSSHNVASASAAPPGARAQRRTFFGRLDGATLAQRLVELLLVGGGARRLARPLGERDCVPILPTRARSRAPRRRRVSARRATARTPNGRALTCPSAIALSQSGLCLLYTSPSPRD